MYRRLIKRNAYYNFLKSVSTEGFLALGSAFPSGDSVALFFLGGTISEWAVSNLQGFLFKHPFFLSSPPLSFFIHSLQHFPRSVSLVLQLSLQYSQCPHLFNFFGKELFADFDSVFFSLFEHVPSLHFLTPASHWSILCSSWCNGRTLRPKRDVPVNCSNSPP